MFGNVMCKARLNRLGTALLNNAAIVIYKCLFFLYVVRVRNEEVRRRAGIERELANRAEQRVLRFFGHMERMDEHCMAKRVMMADVSGGRVRGIPRFILMDGVKVALGNRGMTVRLRVNAQKIGKSGEP